MPATKTMKKKEKPEKKEGTTIFRKISEKVSKHKQVSEKKTKKTVKKPEKPVKAEKKQDKKVVKKEEAEKPVKEAPKKSEVKEVSEKKVEEKKGEAAPEKPEEKPKKKEKVEEKPVLERVYTIPLRKARRGPRTVRASKAVKVVRGYLERHMKAEEVKLGKKLNEKIWERGREKIPSKVRVKASKDKEGVVTAELI